MADLDQIKLQENEYYFDEYFESADSGIEVEYQFPDGKFMTFKLKPYLDLSDRDTAKNRAIKKHFSNEGKLVIDKIDEDLYQLEIVKAAIQYWPFKLRNGKMAPLTDQNVKRLPPHVYDDIVLRMSGVEKQQAEQMIPFGNNSEQA